MTMCSWGSIRQAEVRGWTLEGRSHHLPQPSFCQQYEQAKACGDLLLVIIADLIRMEMSVMPRGQDSRPSLLA